MQLYTRKTNNPIKKLGRRSKQTFVQRRHTDSQKAHEKMLNITNYQRNANQKYNEGISLVVQWLRICLPMQGTWV